MLNIQHDELRPSCVTVAFEHGAISFMLSKDATFEDLAHRLERPGIGQCAAGIDGQRDAWADRLEGRTGIVGDAAGPVNDVIAAVSLKCSSL